MPVETTISELAKHLCDVILPLLQRNALIRGSFSAEDQVIEV